MSHLRAVQLGRGGRLDAIEYFHLEFAEHEVIFAEGAATESYVEDGNRMMFHNAPDCFVRYPGASPRIPSFCAPRVEQGFELESVRRRIKQRAHDLISRSMKQPEHAVVSALAG